MYEKLWKTTVDDLMVWHWPVRAEFCGTVTWPDASEENAAD